jgi:23S rRNA (cytidine1920-2'-O)/16S rRNA (cytidine1409-2'-O)-methyltransferase
MVHKRTKKIRLDKLLLDRGLVESRQKAKALILQGSVLVDGSVIDKAGTSVREDVSLELMNMMPYVSRGGLKLEAVINELGINVKDKVAMDIGASTGGFTDYLLKNGVKRVYAIDVGYGQLHWRLRNDERVIIFEKTNIRYLDRDAIPEEIDLITIDVSFISLLKVIPKAMEFLTPQGEIIALIKPQFELQKRDVGKGGVVRDESKRLEAIEKVKKGAMASGLEVRNVFESPIRGPKGNIEYFIHLKRSAYPCITS